MIGLQTFLRKADFSRQGAKAQRNSAGVCSIAASAEMPADDRKIFASLDDFDLVFPHSTVGTGLPDALMRWPAVWWFSNPEPNPASRFGDASCTACFQKDDND